MSAPRRKTAAARLERMNAARALGAIALPLLAVLVLAACGNARGSAAAASRSGGGEITSPDFARFGSGFLVWESNRTGVWRLWTRRLDGSGLRQLTADQNGRQHCCAAISPDGRWVAYLSLPDDRLEADDEEGEMRLIAPDGTHDHVVVPRAETYSGTFHQWFINGVDAIRTLPTICVQSCSVSNVGRCSA